jgi:hypothetical protein
MDISDIYGMKLQSIFHFYRLLQRVLFTNEETFPGVHLLLSRESGPKQLCILWKELMSSDYDY